MASIKITELNEKTELGTNDLIPIVDITANETKKITGANLLNSQYSINEVKTNMKWIDGKPIYKKVISVTEFPTTSDYEYATISISTGITNMDKPISMNGFYYDNNGIQASWPLTSTYNYQGNDRRIDTRLNSAGTSITLTIPTSDINTFRDYKGYVILEYTKTTD